MAGNDPMAYLQNNPYLGRFRQLMQYAQTGVMPLPTAPAANPLSGSQGQNMFPGGTPAGGAPKSASFFPGMTAPPTNMQQFKGLMPMENAASMRPVMSLAPQGQAPTNGAPATDLINTNPGPGAAAMYQKPQPKVYSTNAPGKPPSNRPPHFTSR